MTREKGLSMMPTRDIEYIVSKVKQFWFAPIFWSQAFLGLCSVLVGLATLLTKNLQSIPFSIIGAVVEPKIWASMLCYSGILSIYSAYNPKVCYCHFRFSVCLEIVASLSGLAMWSALVWWTFIADYFGCNGWHTIIIGGFSIPSLSYLWLVLRAPYPRVQESPQGLNNSCNMSKTMS